MGDKSIKNILILNQYAYLACGFGIVVCDLIKREIKDTYMFGPGGTQIGINSITFDGQYLYAASEAGIYYADINEPNLVDYNSWHKTVNLPDPDAEYVYLAWYDNNVVTVYHNTAFEEDEIIAFDESGWDYWPGDFDSRIGFLGMQNGYLLVSSPDRTKVFDNNQQVVRDEITYYSRYVLFDSENNLWYAASFGGLVNMENQMIVAPDGPEYRDVGDIDILSGILWAGGGNQSTQWLGYGAYSFENEKWTNYHAGIFPELEGILNISEVSIDPGNTKHVIGGSYGYGLVEFLNGSVIDIIDETDGVLQTVPGFGHGYVRITGTFFDLNGDLWISSSNSGQAVYYKRNGSELEAVDLEYTGFGITTDVGEIVANKYGQKWVLLPNNGILVFKDDQGTVTDEKFFVVKNQIPSLLENITAVAEDKDGNMWVGTNKGPVVYYSPSDIFEESDIMGYQPEIPRNDGTSYVDLLLSTVKITDIAVDGANRKWISSESSGVFLVSSDGKEEIHHFTEENSPLLSNNVQTLAINDKTGEVFFGTDKGMISFRGRATEGGTDFGNVYVFPNPVRENYSGDITITGLAANVNVKITDVSGNLVFETTALGGQAIWDGNNFNGQRVHTGIYLVFCTNSDGSKTHITKLLFIH